MATAQLSGYQAAETPIAWAAGQALNSAADNEWTDLSDAIDNSTNKYMFADLMVELASAAFTGTDSGIEVYLIPSLDGGTTDPNWTGNVTTDEQENNQYFVGFLTTSGATAAQTMVLRGVVLPPGTYYYAFRNRGGVALAASGNSASWRPWGYESV